MSICSCKLNASNKLEGMVDMLEGMSRGLGRCRAKIEVETLVGSVGGGSVVKNEHAYKRGCEFRKNVNVRNDAGYLW